jgi:hypothetical protein
MKKLLLTVLVAAFLAGCYYDNEEYLYPKLDTACDTLNVTLSKTILPILQTNCLRCHNATEYAASGGNINLEDYNTISALAVGGVLFQAITQDPRQVPMPKDGTKLDTCSITKIKIWIDHGALNNQP